MNRGYLRTLFHLAKTIDLIKSDNVSIVIQNKNTKTYLESKNVEKNMDITVKTYNKRLYFNIVLMFISVVRYSSR